LTYFYISFNSIIVGGVEITSEIDLSQFCCLNKDCPDFGVKNQGNIAFKEIYGKNTMYFLNVKPVSVALVKQEVLHFLDWIHLRKKF
jgi:hypothetical protein